MNIDLICIGKCREKFWAEAVSEYSRRLGRFCRLSIAELPESRLPEGAGRAQEEAVKEAEGRDIASRLEGFTRQSSFFVALDPHGVQLSSEALALKMANLCVEGKSRIVFAVGGSLGLSQNVLSLCDMRLSFSSMTFPHQLFRVMLLEQIYRAFKINAAEKYHK